jgi:endonuclease YncB( thermonuclease family)
MFVSMTLMVAFLLGGNDEFQGRVTSALEGDTIIVMNGRRPTRVKLVGVDAPEPGQPFADKARQFTSSVVTRKRVLVRVKETDRLGRVTGEVILPDGKSVHEQLLAAGLAWHDLHTSSNDEELAALEAEAKQAKRGLWAASNPIAPWDWRERKRGYRAEGYRPPGSSRQQAN